MASGSNVRIYEVDYLINANPKGAVEGLNVLTKQAQLANEQLSAMTGAVRKASLYLQSLQRQKDLVGKLFTVQPKFDEAAFKAQLSQMEAMAEKSAAKISAMMNKALAGTGPKKGAGSAVKGGKGQTVTPEMFAKIDEKTLHQMFRDAQKQILVSTEKEAKVLKQRMAAINRSLADRGAKTLKLDGGEKKSSGKKAKVSASESGIITNLANTIKKDNTVAKNAKSAAKGFDQLVTSIKSLNRLKDKGITVTLNVGKSVENAAALNKELKSLWARKAKTITVTLKADGVLATLRKINAQLNAMPKNVSVSVAGTGTKGGGTGVAGTSTRGSGSTQTSKPKMTSGQAWIEHELQQNAAKIKASRNYGKNVALKEAAYHESRHAMYKDLFGPNPGANGLYTSGGRSANPFSNGQHNIAASKYLRDRAYYDVDGLRSGKYTPMGGSYLSGNGYRRPAAPPKDFYARARTLWYPFTGNTSFGARTPMMVDMAKGMGTMFAVGGAMSAIGGSIGQAIEYQNMMKTTQAILRNSDDSYSLSGFRDMEKNVRNIGVKTKFSAPEVASAARFMSMAGMDINAINKSIRPIADVALIGDTELGTTADKMTNVMTTFGISPDKVRDAVDIMTNTFTRTNTDLMMLAESAKYAGGVADLYGGHLGMNNFSDVMAMFGIMGNRGIQASSAGTTLRMMYSNIMQPNKKQKAILDQYGINTRQADGQRRAMSDILIEMASKVDKKTLGDFVGGLFRITAQPGATALLKDLTGGDESLMAQVIEDNSKLESVFGSGGKSGSKLVDLMISNRAAAGSGISQEIANEKQNTISGLWAQVTSTFTEGIVKAFENREGGWAGMLTHLRDYLAKPETVQMLSSLVDLVEMLVKTMGRFAQVWAKIYNAAPTIINLWMHAQMLFTQVGYLATPFIQMIGVLSNLKNALLGVNAAAAVTGGRLATGSALSNAAATGAMGTAMAGSAVRGGAIRGGVRMAGSSALATGAMMASGGLVAAPNAGAVTKTAMIRTPISSIGMLPHYGFVPGPIGYRNLPKEAAARAAIQERIAMYQRNRSYMTRGFTKSQKAQQFKSIDKMVANMRAQQTALTAAGFFGHPMLSVFGGNDYSRHGRVPQPVSYNTIIPERIMPFHENSGRVNSIFAPNRDKNGHIYDNKVVYNADGVKAANAAEYRRRAGLYNAAYLAAMARPNGFNSVKMAGGGTMPSAGGFGARNPEIMRQKAEFYMRAAREAEAMQKAEMLAAREAARKQSFAARRPAQLANSALISRLGSVRMASNGVMSKGFWQGAGNMVLAGRMAGSFSGIGVSIRSMFTSLMGGLAKAVGMLLSPVGLATTAIVTLGIALYKMVDNQVRASKQLEALQASSAWVEEAKARIANDKISAGAGAGGIGIRSIGYVKEADEEQSKTYSISENEHVKKLLHDDTKLLNAEDIYGTMVGKFASYLPTNTIESYNNALKLYKHGSPNDPNKGTEMDAARSISRTYKRSNAARDKAIELGVIAQWADTAVSQEDFKKAMQDLYDALYINPNNGRVQDILKAYRPQDRAMRMTGMGAEAISNITNPTQFYEWQYAQYKVLNDMIGENSPIYNFFTALNKLTELQANVSSNVGANFFDENAGLAQMLMGSVPIEWMGKKGAIVFDSNGMVDWAKLADTINNGTRFSMEEQWRILNEVYTALLDDPQFSQFSNVIDLLGTYLPQIANAKSPLEQAMWNFLKNPWSPTPGPVDTGDKSKPVPYAPTPKPNPTGFSFTDYNDPFKNPMGLKPTKNDYIKKYGVVNGIIKFQEANGANPSVNIPQPTTPTVTTTTPPSYGGHGGGHSGGHSGGKGGNTNSKHTGKGYAGGGHDNGQKDYASSYDRSSARPTQVIINIDSLARFDRTAISKDADDAAIISAIESKISEAVGMLASQALNATTSVISQGV